MKSIVSPHIRIRVPDHFVVGEDSIIDDFCYFSTRIEVGRNCHIANSCSVGGGHKHLFTLGDFGTLSAGVRIWCASTDFVRDFAGISEVEIPDSQPIEGDVRLDRHVAVGSNSVVMPDNQIPEGVAIGAMSFVPPRFEFKSWSVYRGIPIRHARARDRENVLRQIEFIEKSKKG
jgi:acetyltransferase-like isoleucine patch superfamily enzyme